MTTLDLDGVDLALIFQALVRERKKASDLTYVRLVDLIDRIHAVMPSVTIRDGMPRLTKDDPT